MREEVNNRSIRKPMFRPVQSTTDALGRILTALDVNLLSLTGCLVSGGCRSLLADRDMPGLHYILAGKGRVRFENGESIAIRPHTLIITPPKHRIVVEVSADGITPELKQGTSLPEEAEDLKGIAERFAARERGVEVNIICGTFQALHGDTINPFAKLLSPLIEKFEYCDHMDELLKMAMVEFDQQRFGASAMMSALMKQVFVTLFRRGVVSESDWLERLSATSDAQVTRALAEMVSRPGAAHSVQSLAQMAGLSRSAFMERFTTHFGRSPMALLRDLRMRRAALLLTEHQIDQVAHMVGYANRSSFCRAFYKSQGDLPSDFRGGDRTRSGQVR